MVHPCLTGSHFLCWFGLTRESCYHTESVECLGCPMSPGARPVLHGQADGCWSPDLNWECAHHLEEGFASQKESPKVCATPANPGAKAAAHQTLSWKSQGDRRPSVPLEHCDRWWVVVQRVGTWTKATKLSVGGAEGAAAQKSIAVTSGTQDNDGGFCWQPRNCAPWVSATQNDGDIKGLCWHSCQIEGGSALPFGRGIPIGCCTTTHPGTPQLQPLLWWSRHQWKQCHTLLTPLIWPPQTSGCSHTSRVKSGVASSLLCQLCRTVSWKSLVACCGHFSTSASMKPCPTGGGNVWQQREITSRVMMWLCHLTSSSWNHHRMKKNSHLTWLNAQICCMHMNSGCAAAKCSINSMHIAEYEPCCIVLLWKALWRFAPSVFPLYIHLEYIFVGQKKIFWVIFAVLVSPQKAMFIFIWTSLVWCPCYLGFVEKYFLGYAGLISLWNFDHFRVCCRVTQGL